MEQNDDDLEDEDEHSMLILTRCNSRKTMHWMQVMRFLQTHIKPQHGKQFWLKVNEASSNGFKCNDDSDHHGMNFSQGDEKDVEMQGKVVVDEDGIETIMPPKKGRIKYSPLGAVNLAATNSNNLSIYRESVASQSHPSHSIHPSQIHGFSQKSSTFEHTMPNIRTISIDASSIIPSINPANP